MCYNTIVGNFSSQDIRRSVCQFNITISYIIELLTSTSKFNLMMSHKIEINHVSTCISVQCVKVSPGWNIVQKELIDLLLPFLSLLELVQTWVLLQWSCFFKCTIIFFYSTPIFYFKDTVYHYTCFNSFLFDVASASILIPHIKVQTNFP